MQDRVTHVFKQQDTKMYGRLQLTTRNKWKEVTEGFKLWTSTPKLEVAGSFKMLATTDVKTQKTTFQP
jgi:hypothetical protein